MHYGFIIIHNCAGIFKKQSAVKCVTYSRHAYQKVPELQSFEFQPAVAI